MNSNQFNNSIKSLRSVQLAPKDKEAVFNTLRSYAANHPAVEKSGLFSGTLEMIKASLGIRFRF